MRLDSETVEFYRKIIRRQCVFCGEQAAVGEVLCARCYVRGPKQVCGLPEGWPMNPNLELRPVWAELAEIAEEVLEDERKQMRMLRR